ncbi:MULTISPECIES: alpha/beta hydrolase [unclassified Cupriavidus]|uniref:alpha/beta hydrolase n=1 Tax=unclassified Cupriavidus TaxID=2640874 RepID=UPI0003BE53E5|nr:MULTISPECIES: alpha/beta hydrolase [unclassified Cupriavidus]ESJ18696.1 alpha/beta hydrolase [Cupriavidus sp. HPC(L)]MCD9122139.1 alpha/beta hydrolase [Cupriavidus sp. UGS-1]
MDAFQATAIAPAESRQRMRDGTELLLRTWLPDSRLWPEPSGTLLLVHGLAEHCGRYAHVAARLCALGLRVLAYDQRGHGASGGARMVAERPDVFLEDLVEIYDGAVQRWPELPIVLGHSMGGLVAARLATSRVRPVRALVLSSPALALRIDGAMLTLQRMLLTLAPNLRVPSPIRPSDLSHDPAEVASYRSDPLVQRTLTAGILHSMMLGIERAQADAPLLEAPTLLLVAGADRVVDPAGSRRFCDNAPADLRECVWFEHAYHEIFNEQAALRTEVLDALSDWLRRHLQPVADADR